MNQAQILLSLFLFPTSLGGPNTVLLTKVKKLRVGSLLWLPPFCFTLSSLENFFQHVDTLQHNIYLKCIETREVCGA